MFSKYLQTYSLFWFKKSQKTYIQHLSVCVCVCGGGGGGGGELECPNVVYLGKDS